MKRLGATGLFYAGAVAAGYGLELLNFPLPWMIGAMLFAAAFTLSGKAPAVPRAIRATGQVIVATAVGLYFMPEAVTQLVAEAGYMIAAAIITTVASGAAGVVLARTARIDATTAFFASIPGGPVEMAAFAEQFGGKGAPVALAQTLRVAFIVTVIPPVLLWSDTGIDIGLSRTEAGIRLVDLGALYTLTSLVAIALNRLRFTSAFFLGPLGVAAFVTALGFPMPDVPGELIAAGQILLGVSLGTKFDRTLLRGARRFTLAAALTTSALLGFSILLALGMAAVSGLAPETLVLATAPGSITEMALTAKALELNVALVTAFHVVRIFIVLPAAPLIFRLANWLLRRRVGSSRKQP